jgi:DNA ligase-associated metallophosphoesterase
LPAGTTTRLVERLARSVESTGADTVVFLGDFLHSKAGRAPRTLERFAAWRDGCGGLKLRLVRGNHDARAGDPPVEWGFDCVEEGEVAGPFVLAHHPGALVGGYALSGHIHPAVYIAERAGPGMRLPCFWMARDYAVLPAFGEFTGTAVVEPEAGDRVFVVADDEVIEVRRR